MVLKITETEGSYILTILKELLTDPTIDYEEEIADCIGIVEAANEVDLREIIALQ